MYSAECRGPVELGRQTAGDQPPYSAAQTARGWRIVLAQATEEGVSRKHILLEPLPDGRARVTNQSNTVPIRFPDGGELVPGATRDLPVPLLLSVGPKVV